MGADNQAERVIARLERQQMAQETAKRGTTLQIYYTAKQCRQALEKQEEEALRRFAERQMGDNDG